MAQPSRMVRLLKFALFVVLFYVLLTLAIMIGSGETGQWEKTVIAGLATGVFALAVQIHRIGSKAHESAGERSGHGA